MCKPWDVGCLGAKVVSGAVKSGVDAMAMAIDSGVTWVVENTVAWWVNVPSVDPAQGADVARTPVPAAPVVAEIQADLWLVTLTVAVGGVVAAGIRMALTRKPDPLFSVGRGLAVLAATGVLGVAIPAALLRAGDEFSDWVIQRSLAGGDIGGRLAMLMSLGDGVPAGAVIVLGIVAIIVSLVQAVLMMFRQGSVLILTGALLLAASGQFAEASRPWFQRVTGWMLALICYKPAAALIYAAAFTLAGKSQDPTSVLVGFAMIVLSLVALPALVRLFTWATGNAATAASGGGAAAISAGAYGLIAVGSLSSRGSGGGAAADQAQYLNQQVGDRSSGAGPASVSAPSLAPTSNPPAGSSAGAGAGQAGAGAAAVPGQAAQAGQAAPAAGGAASSATVSAAAKSAAAAAGPAGAAAAVVAEAVRAAGAAAGTAGTAMGKEPDR